MGVLIYIIRKNRKPPVFFLNASVIDIKPCGVLKKIREVLYLFASSFIFLYFIFIFLLALINVCILYELGLQYTKYEDLAEE